MVAAGQGGSFRCHEVPLFVKPDYQVVESHPLLSSVGQTSLHASHLCAVEMIQWYFLASTWYL